MVTIWQNLGFTFILMSAALQSLPEEVLEASRVDGASSWVRFRSITLPPPLTDPVLRRGGWDHLGVPGLRPDRPPDPGGPEPRHLVLIYDLYQQAFQFNNPGYAAVLSIALFVILLILTFVQFWFFQRRVSYASD